MNGTYKTLIPFDEGRREVFLKAFKEHGTDKYGYHTYVDVYARLFEDTNSVTDVLEMGIHLGASLKAWRDVFMGANIVGLDNNPERFINEGRISSAFVDQSDLESFKVFLESNDGREFDLIVDDGSHYLQETKNTFSELLPVLKSGGAFVVEDIRSEFLEEWYKIANGLSDGFVWDFFDMNSLADTKGDNILFVVRRLP